VPFPVTDAFDALAELAGRDAQLLWGDSPDGLIWAVGARRDDGEVVLIANLDRVQRELTVVIEERSTSVHLEPLSFSRV
jgi:hypothetical protein